MFCCCCLSLLLIYSNIGFSQHHFALFTRPCFALFGCLSLCELPNGKSSAAAFCLAELTHCCTWEFRCLAQGQVDSGGQTDESHIPSFLPRVCNPACGSSPMTFHLRGSSASQECASYLQPPPPPRCWLCVCGGGGSLPFTLPALLR